MSQLRKSSRLVSQSSEIARRKEIEHKKPHRMIAYAETSQ
jgi:hypothetical protein